MNATVKRIVELLFQDVERTDEVKALEEEILNNCQDRYEDQIAQGRSEDDAIAAVVDSLKGMEDVLAEYRKRSPEQETVQEAKSILDGVLEQLSDMAKAFGKLGSKFVTVTVGDEDDEHAEDDEDDEEHADEDKDDDGAHGSETMTIKLGGSRKHNGEAADEDERVLTFDPAQIETLQFNLLDETVEITEGTADTVVVRCDKDTPVEVSQKEGVLLFEHKSSAKRQNKSAGLSAKLLQLMIRSVGGDQDGAEAAERPHDGDKIYKEPLEFPLAAESNVQHRKDHQAAQMERQAQRVEVHAAAGALEQVAHDLAHLAERADRSHYISRPAESQELFTAHEAHSYNKHGAQAYPDKMLSSEHSNTTLCRYGYDYRTFARTCQAAKAKDLFRGVSITTVSSE